MHSFNSLDIVLAFATSTVETSVNLHQQDLQEILRHVDAKMPVALQKLSTFSLLGICILECRTQNIKIPSYPCTGSSKSREKKQSLEVEDNTASSSILNDSMHNYFEFVRESSPEDCGRCRYGCKKLDPSIETVRQALIESGNWIQLFSRAHGSSYKEARWIPEIDHIHEDGDMLPAADFHLILYDLPTYGRHHYTLTSWTNYFNHKAPIPDLAAVVSALNCSYTAKKLLQKRLLVEVPVCHLSLCWLTSKLWYILAVFLATMSTVMYITFQMFYVGLNFGFYKFATIILKKVLGHTWKQMHIRICQILYWPIFLLGSGFSSHSNAEFAHKDAVRKHFMWSSIAVDLLLGAVYGLTVMINADFIFFWIKFIARDITDNLLRSGCVWLMGIPAGFKLNTELAELFGMISLNAIQTFSTLWLFMDSFLPHFIRGLAISGILFGLTIPAALCIDILTLVTLHVSALHWLISFVYSQQIESLGSIWRLFSGRKWNPLRQRLDSYDDYSVEQHVVGSLMFTPLLLLLPTTSVFYIFFTLLSTSAILLRLLIEIIISVLHATPYTDILLWLTSRRCFPSGIWFEIISGTMFLSSSSSTSGTDERSSNGLHQPIVSILHSNYATLGQIVLPCYARVFRMVSPTFCKEFASRILSGRRIPSSLDTYLPPTLPWMQLSLGEYWRLCYCSIVGCSF